MNTDRRTGYIALLDVLGFSELISRESRNDDLQRYFDAIDVATSSDGQPVEFVLFSDTIVISAPDDSEHSLLAVLRAASFAMHYLLAAGLPVRGAISHGGYLRSQSEKGVLIAGAAFVEAYRFEKAQNWVGILVTPSVLRSFPALTVRCAAIPNQVGSPETRAELEDRIDWAILVQQCHAIPWHGSNPFGEDRYTGYAVVPTDPGWRREAREIAAGLKGIAQRLADQRLLAADPQAQSKYDVPHQWIGSLVQAWQGLANQMGAQT